MKYTLMLGLGGVDEYLEMARTADQAGWDCIGLPDSIFFPKVNESDYPYADTEMVRNAVEGVPVIDPFIAMSMMAAVTKNIHIYPAVMKIPVRQPIVLAKALSSLAYMTGNRVKLGAGLSPWKEDFVHNGVTWEGRGKRMDECIEIIRGVMSGDYYEYHGDYYDFAPVKLSPVPSKPVPVIIGGHAKPALRRAARIGDGWISANSDFESLSALVEQINQLRSEYGTINKPFEFHCLDSAAQSADDFKRLASIGTTHACVTPWNPYDPSVDSKAKIEAIKRFADNFVR
jgi:probable F420-dependent oxidoreductase